MTLHRRNFSSYKTSCIEVYSAILLADQEKKNFADNNKHNRRDEVLPPIKRN